MPTDGSYSGNSLDASQYARVDQISLAFEKAWLSGSPPRLEEYFGRLQADDPVREVLFRELLLLDIHYRREQGEQPGIELYQERFPRHLGLIQRSFSDSLPSQEAEAQGRKADALPLPADDTDSKSGEAAPSTSQVKHDREAGAACAPPLTSHSPRYLGRYEIVKQLGKGKFGRVYLARDSQLDRLVAIKVSRSGLFSSQESAARFLSEARKAAQLDKHPGIVTIHDVGSKDDDYYIVMDYVEGGTLAEPKSGEGLSIESIVNVIARVADAVHFAHTKGLVHRDIKPANILLDGNGDPKVADFGLAIHESEQSSMKGEISGTLHYMSPEQALGHTDRLDGRTDIWSLGTTLYELLTRRRPFSGDTREELVDQILHRDVKPPRQIDDGTPHALEQVCLTALQKEPSARQSTARDFARDLRQAARNEQARSPWRFGLRAWIVSCTLVMVFAVVLGVLLSRPKKGDDEGLEWDGGRGPVTVSGPLAPEPPEFARTLVPFDEKHANVTCIGMSADGRYAASADQDGLVCVWNLRTGEFVDGFEAPGTVWNVRLSDAGDRVAALCVDRPYVVLRSIPELQEISYSPVGAQAPGLLLPGSDAHSISAIMVLNNELRLQGIEGAQEPSLIVFSPWSRLAAARVDGHVVIAGYLAALDEWRVKTWEPGALPGTRPQDVPIDGSGPICSVDVAEKGQIVIGGYDPGVGVQVWLGGDASPIRLDAGEQGAGLYYHQVAISPDAAYVYAVSRHVPPPESTDQGYALLRAWSISPTAPVDDWQKVVEKKTVPAPVQAASFLPDQRRLLLSASQTLQLWEF